MQRSLSMLLPVQNAQATLAATVHELLDLMADTIDRFELIIVDDGSSDATSEIAVELTRHYPQVRVACHSVPQGIEAATRTGLKRSQGEVVVVRGPDGGFRMLKHRRLSNHPPGRIGRPNYLDRLDNLSRVE